MHVSGGSVSSGASRDEMERALRSMVDDQLRPAGFSGSFPHYRRILDDRVDLLSFPFFSAGGSFVVEVACAPVEGITSGGRLRPAKKLRAWDVAHPRPRLGSSTFPEGAGRWFVFGPRTYEQPATDGYPPPRLLADEVVRLVREQAEPWWATRPFPRPWGEG